MPRRQEITSEPLPQESFEPVPDNIGWQNIDTAGTHVLLWSQTRTPVSGDMEYICVTCKKPISFGQMWDFVDVNQYNSERIHYDCITMIAKCRGCKHPIAAGRRVVTHPTNPRFKYHESCCIRYTDGNEYKYYHPSWTMTDHLGHKFIPKNNGLATYRAAPANGTPETRKVSIKTMLKLKKAGIIRRASVSYLPEEWGGDDIDYIGNDSRPPRFFASNGDINKTPAPDPNGHEYVGCELEVERGELFKEALLTKTQRSRIHASVSDGSISGVEVLTSPSAGRELVKTMRSVATALSNMGWEGTNACGAHQHVNFKNRASDEHIRRIMLLTRKLEPFILERLPERRRTAHYCEPIKEKWSLNDIEACDSDDIDTMIYGTSDRYEIDDMKQDKYCDVRYSGTNFHSIYFRGTVEFRYLEGTTDFRRLSSFGLFYASLVEQVNKSREEWGKFWSVIRHMPYEEVPFKMDVPSMTLLRRLNNSFLKS